MFLLALLLHTAHHPHVPVAPGQSVHKEGRLVRVFPAGNRSFLLTLQESPLRGEYDFELLSVSAWLAHFNLKCMS